MKVCIINDEVIQSMGVYFNPGNASFTRARNSQIFVDKTGLIEYLNKRMSRPSELMRLISVLRL